MEISPTSKIELGFGFHQNTWVFKQLYRSERHRLGRDDHTFVPNRCAARCDRLPCVRAGAWNPGGCAHANRGNRPADVTNICGSITPLIGFEGLYLGRASLGVGASR